MFKKTCFECAKKVEKLYDGRCINCFKLENPPIKTIKSLNLKICNMCRKIHYNNSLLTIDELEELLPKIVEKRVELNKGYTLKRLDIKNFEILGHKVSFDVEVDCDLL